MVGLQAENDGLRIVGSVTRVDFCYSGPSRNAEQEIGEDCEGVSSTLAEESEVEAWVGQT
jgi:hypothetical protein